MNKFAGLCLAILGNCATICSQNPLGVFDLQTDVGAVLHPGTTTYDEKSQTYELAGSGANIWFKKDEFHYACKKVTGNCIVQARVHFIGTGVEMHRKTGWMFRSTLDSSAAMVSATVHGDGLTCIQYRKKTGMNIEEVKTPVKMPDVIQLERRGRSFILSVAHFGEPFWSVEVPDFDLPDELYAGLFICSHNKDVVEKAAFDNVQITIPARPDFVPYKDYIGSQLEVLDLESGRLQCIYSAENSIQAPNWLADNSGLLFNSSGKIFKLAWGSNQPVMLNTGSVTGNNNDHVLSFDGKMIGLSSSSDNPHKNSLGYTVPAAGGEPKLVAANDPSYLHGWSPDGKWLLFTGQRNGDYNIFKIKSSGGKEIQLSDAPGLDDGPEFSPDGKWIYFNSVAGGKMEIWRMKPDGKSKQQVTSDEFQNWFPHVSPDGKWIAFISFMPEVQADDHPFYKQVYIRLMPVNGGKPKVVAYVYGGQGTLNVPSWSPDSRKIAFVSNSDIRQWKKADVSVATTGHPVIPLWENGAPGSESRKNEREEAQDWWVKNIHNPSVTVFLPPADIATGAGVVVCPGGGHRRLVYNSEGRDAAAYLNSIGVAAFVLKYRLFREENSIYTEKDTRADGLRAMRMVRRRAGEFGVDPNRLGIMGFSAGGELAAWTSFADGKGNPEAEDLIERTNAHPNFQILVYPGPLAVPPDEVKTTLPPSFFVAADDDECCSEPLLTLTAMYRKAKVPVELHLYAQGNHAFNMGKRTTLASLSSWPQRLTDWLRDNKWLDKK